MSKIVRRQPSIKSSYPLILRDNKVSKSRNLPLTTLHEVFDNNVVELKFNRRTPLSKNKKAGHMKPTRRMLCTTNWRLISSPLTRFIYKWKKPKTRRGRAWYRQRNLIIVWDLMQKGFRMVSLDSYIIVGYTPVSTFTDKVIFTEFYMSNLYRSSKLDRNKFSDK